MVRPQPMPRGEETPPGARPGPDQDRFRKLFADHFDFVVRSLRNLGVSTNELDDATQQVFIVGWQRLDTIRLDVERAFLFQTAVRIASRARRTMKRRREDDLSVTATPVDARLADEHLEQRQMRQLVDRILAELPMDQRTVFLLYEVEQYSTQEIARTLDLPQGTVKSRLRRAREIFELHVRGLREDMRHDTLAESGSESS